ncbi:MAG: hypothetical protein FWD15_03330 [Alphaproteobacteria bacterium]|nr:hypothetical protein [Alphaproteobacteria bacterium]
MATKSKTYFPTAIDNTDSIKLMEHMAEEVRKQLAHIIENPKSAFGILSNGQYRDLISHLALHPQPDSVAKEYAELTRNETSDNKKMIFDLATLKRNLPEVYNGILTLFINRNKGQKTETKLRLYTQRHNHPYQ